MAGPGSAPGQWGAVRQLLEHEQIFCTGDLNYRLSLDEQDTREALKRGDMDTLLAADELNKMRATGALQCFPLWSPLP